MREPDQRLIQQQQARISSQGPSNGYALPLAAGELMREVVLMTLQAYVLDQGFHTLRNLSSRQSSHPQRKGDVAGDRHMWKQRVALEDSVNRSRLRRDAREVAPLEQDLTQVGLQKATDLPQQGGLPAS
ncbi:hypothetical protein DL770_011482 [Monosporascus sp. CRB-9-2]|nr:hypothetical protein DL770_011482 [Monosporascus sp. CRB-9-2]